MTEQLKISFNTLNTADKTEFMPSIGIFGRKNSGKSSLVNLLAGNDASEVSKCSGTTKEPFKSYSSLEGIGRVQLIDTSGIDDYGESGEKRVAKTMDVLKVIDLAIIVITGNLFAEPEKNLVSKFLEFSIPFIVVHNKSDLQELSPVTKRQVETAYQTNLIEFNCTNGISISSIVDVLRNVIPDSAYESKSILGNIVAKNDLVILAAPDQLNAADGQLTQPQIEITRDLLENSCMSLFVKQKDLPDILETITPKPKLTILPTSSFKQMEEILPTDLHLTTYGIVMSRYRGDFIRYLEDTPKLSSLNDNDRILILQAATDSTSNEYKEQELVQTMISEFSQKKLNFSVVKIFEKPFIIYNQYKFAIICGSYLLTKNQIAEIIKPFIQCDIPVTSFDMVNAYIRGIFLRSISPFLL
jgi:[FeFe] hydrogenase H-cluster maturation GTPase HydF